MDWNASKLDSAKGQYDGTTGRYYYEDATTRVGSFVTYSGPIAVIAFEGTNPSNWHDWANDVFGVFPQIEHLIPIIDAFDQFVAIRNNDEDPDNNIITVYVTGHSLGGGLA